MNIEYLIVGAERCGTTSLYANMIKHSLVTPAYTKEIEFFDRYYDRGVDWYHKQFDGDGIHGEATPTYLWNPVVPGRVKKYNPQMKIIILWPEEKESRIISKYKQQVSKGVEVLSLKDALRFEDIRINGELKRCRELPYNYYPNLYVDYAYKDRYCDAHVDRWVSLFDVLLIRDFFTANQNRIMGRVFDYIGVPFEEHEWEHLNKCVE